MTSGQAVFTLGGFVSGESGYVICVIGRVIFGLGGESLNVCQTVIVSWWFFGKELAFALGLNITISRLGSVFNNLVEPPIADAMGLGPAMLFGLILCGVGYAAGIGIIIMDWIAAKRDKLDLNIKEGEIEKVKCEDMKSLGISFWLVAFNCLFTYLGIFPFTNISTGFFRSSFNFNQIESGRLTSTVFLISAFLAPMWGFFCDKIGHRVTFCITSAAILTGAHLMFIVLGQCNWCYIGAFPMVMIGLAYSIYVSALWPMVPYVVKPQVVGTAYGLVTSIQNMGMGFGPNLIGYI